MDPSWTLARRGGATVRYVLLACFGIAFVFPLVWMFLTSLKDIREVMVTPPVWVPAELRWSNYIDATLAIPFWRYAANTLALAVLNVVGTIISSSLAAYGFSRIEWPGRDRLFAATLATMMIPFPVLMIPLYSIFLEFGWIGTFKPLWVPAFLGSAYNIFLLRQFFLSIPGELSEAARIDGCREWRIYWQIVMPLSRPALMVVGLFSFLYVWNDFMGPLVYLTDQKDFTLALGLQHFQSRQGGSPFNLLMAAATLTVVPVVVLFFFMQKTFLEGVSLSRLRR